MSETATTFRFEIGPDDASSRLDHALVKLLAGTSRDTSRAQIKQWIQSGCVTVDGRAATRASGRVPAHAIVIVSPPRIAEFETAARSDIVLRILHDDPSIIVVDKPSGLVVHPAAGHRDDTLVNALVARYPDIVPAFAAAEGSDDATGEAERAASRPGIVHRLDRDTSGVMVIARTPEALRSLIAQFKVRSVRKTYIAITRGVIKPPAGLIDGPVGRDPRHRQRMAVLPGGKAARTRYRVLDATDNHALVLLHPETGRTHQIRVHLRAMHAPVAGDLVYGGRDPRASRLALHAWRLAFDHPLTGERARFEAAPPGDWLAAAEESGLAVNLLPDEWDAQATPR